MLTANSNEIASRASSYSNATSHRSPNTSSHGIARESRAETGDVLSLSNNDAISQTLRRAAQLSFQKPVESPRSWRELMHDAGGTIREHPKTSATTLVALVLGLLQRERLAQLAAESRLATHAIGVGDISTMASHVHSSLSYVANESVRYAALAARRLFS